MQALTLKIETLMRAQDQVTITTPQFLTRDWCGIVHGLEECTVDDELAATMDEDNFFRRKTLINNTPTISRALGRIKECISLIPCKIKGLDKRRDNPPFKRPFSCISFNLLTKIIKLSITVDCISNYRRSQRRRWGGSRWRLGHVWWMGHILAFIIDGWNKLTF